jgi:hypothetical protein
MATDNRLRDTASDYNDIYSNPDGRFGIENARVARGDREQSLTSRPSEDGRRGRPVARRYRGPQESTDFVDKASRREQMVDERYYRDPREEIPSEVIAGTAPQKTKVRTSLFARGRGITFGFITMSWLLPIYFFWQVPMSIIGAIALGLSFQIESSFLSSVSGLLPSFSLFGYDFNTLAGLGMLALISSTAIGVLTSCVVAFTAVLAGLHPLSGNEAGSKHNKFLVGVVGGCIPFINLFPWIIFWILSVMRHPK